MLHPTIGEDFLPKTNHYLPGGFLTLNNLFEMNGGETKKTKRLIASNKSYS